MVSFTHSNKKNTTSPVLARQALNGPLLSGSDSNSIPTCCIWTQGYLDLITHLLSFSLQGRHVKTGQLAAIKVMDVTEVSKNPKTCQGSSQSLNGKKSCHSLEAAHHYDLYCGFVCINRKCVFEEWSLILCLVSYCLTFLVLLHTCWIIPVSNRIFSWLVIWETNRIPFGWFATDPDVSQDWIIILNVSLIVIWMTENQYFYLRVCIPMRACLPGLTNMSWAVSAWVIVFLCVPTASTAMSWQPHKTFPAFCIAQNWMNG